VGWALCIYGVVVVLVQGVLVRRLRWSPLTLLRVGIPFAAFGLFAFTFAHTRSALVISMALQGFGQAFAAPGTLAALSLGVRDDEQGAVAGLNSASQALGRTIGPMLGTGLYSVHPEYPYAFGGALLLFVLGVLWLRGSLLTRTLSS
jgi:predicted MFS family arabinose efflux permease